MMLSEEDFARLCQYIHTHYGIELEKKKQLITSRLAGEVEDNGYADYHPYINDVVSGRRPDLIAPMLVKITTNYTYFAREQEHFNFLKDTVLPEMKKRHRGDRCLSIWSAGCSSGEEPYNLSMYLLDFFGAEADLWDTRVLATDISEEMLRKAENPIYTASGLDSLPAQWRQRYFEKRPDGLYTVTEQLRDNVIFRRFNLMDPIQFRKKFDIIFCRNVMIYFDPATKDALVRRFYQATAPGGYLFIGHSEGISRESCPYQYVCPAVYRKG